MGVCSSKLSSILLQMMNRFTKALGPAQATQQGGGSLAQGLLLQKCMLKAV